jgi:hypothetical protein
VRAALILCSVLALSACGSSKNAQPTSTQPAQAPPAVEAIDEPAQDYDLPKTSEAAIQSLCADKPESCQPTPDQFEKLIQATEPARGVKARGIAQLRLPARGPNARARLIVWRNNADELCLVTEWDYGSDGPFGPCDPEDPCAQICLQISQTGSGTKSRYLISGVVAAVADDLRITLDDRRIQDFGLTGPLVPGFPKYRVFMLDLGRDVYEQLALRHDDKVIAEEKLPHDQIRFMRCAEEFPPVSPSQEQSGLSAQFLECVGRAAPK